MKSSSSSAATNRSASTSSSVNATSSSGTVANPSACHIRSARAIEIPARSDTWIRVNFRSPPSNARSNSRCRPQIHLPTSRTGRLA